MPHVAKEEIVIEPLQESGEGVFVEQLATDREGNALTLLQEYSGKRVSSDRRQLIFAAACAGSSLAFAALTYLKTF